MASLPDFVGWGGDAKIEWEAARTRVGNLESADP